MHFSYESKDDTRKAQVISALENNHDVPVPCASSQDIWGQFKDICFIDDRNIYACNLGCSGSVCKHKFDDQDLRRCARLSYEGVEAPDRDNHNNNKGKNAGGNVVVISQLDNKLREFWDAVADRKSLTKSMELDIVREDERELMYISEAPLVCVALLKMQEASLKWNNDDLRSKLHESVKSLRVVACSSLFVRARAVAACYGHQVEVCSEKERKVCALQLAERPDGAERDEYTLHITRDVLDSRFAEESELAKVRVAKHVCMYVCMVCMQGFVCMYVSIYLSIYISMYIYIYIILYIYIYILRRKGICVYVCLF